MNEKPENDMPDAEALTPAPEMEEIVEADAEAPVEDDPHARIAELEAEALALKDRLLRAVAEADNIRKRAEREVRDERTFAIERFARDLLSVSDNFSRTFDAVDEAALSEMSEKGQALFKGVELTQKELHAIFARHGVVAIDASPGAAFDPNQHQAVSQMPSEQAKGSVAVCFAPGWKLGDRVLRAAMVAVSTGPAN